MSRSELLSELDTLKVLSAQQLIRDYREGKRFENIHEAEFRVFSQWGDDGIIQYLLTALDVPDSSFVEFGIKHYRESNTRFLLLNNNWRGLLMDGDPVYIEELKQDQIYWKYEISAGSHFITIENVNALLEQYGFVNEIGLLHIDIDGNEFHIWQAIQVARPVLLILEYNSVFGPDLEVTVPYRPDFDRTRAHHSNLYYGASLAALVALSQKKGYAFVGCNSNGNNAYFVLREKLPPSIKELGVKEGYVQSKFRESRGSDGELTFLTGRNRRTEIGHLPLLDLRSGEVRPVRELYER
ncbi:MAG: hypothetical protein HS115_10205 [Spirochaetales bacterium]|nr:hypothetical protein [Spirochaetales bacterium]